MFEEVKILNPDVFTDYRGDIWTTYTKNDFPDLDFNHDKYSTSRRNVIRGIHGDFKTSKLISCLHGKIYFVVVDNREESKNYLKWSWLILSGYNKKQVLLPPGFGNAFCVLSEECLFSYNEVAKSLLQIVHKSLITLLMWITLGSLIAFI